MTTKWINKDKFKTKDLDSVSDIDNNFSIKEAFEDKNYSSDRYPLLDKNPLAQFLLANPLKSIFDIEQVDSRNVKESFDDQNNIKPLGTPTDKQNNQKNNNDADNKLLESILMSLFSLFLTLYVSYNWYFNLTEGFAKRIEFYEKFDFINYLYFFSEYFYKIIRFFDETISIRMPHLVNLFKDNQRSIYILILYISYYTVNTFISLLSRVYKYVKTYVQGRKIDLMKIIYDPTNKLVFFSLLFSYYVIEGIITSFIPGPPGDTSIAESFKGSLNSFKVAHPLIYVAFILIRIAIVMGPTISFASTMFSIYFIFYSLLGIASYKYYNTDPIHDTNLYSGVREGSFIDMFRRIHAVININRILFEPDNDEIMSKIKRYFEKFLRIVFSSLPFLIMFYGLFRTIPSILKFNSQIYKMSGIALISAVSIVLFKFMLDENPKVYVLQELIKSKISTISESLLQIFEDGKNEDGKNEDGKNEGVSTEGVSTEGVSTEGVSTEGVSTEGVTNEGVSTEGVTNEGVSTEDGTSPNVSTEDGTSPNVSTEDGTTVGINP